MDHKVEDRSVTTSKMQSSQRRGRKNIVARPLEKFLFQQAGNDCNFADVVSTNLMSQFEAFEIPRTKPGRGFSPENSIRKHAHDPNTEKVMHSIIIVREKVSSAEEEKILLLDRLDNFLLQQAASDYNFSDSVPM
ncbi:uncharacterized protein LOC117223037 [Megalopta genalis]|uniref:uncharacterized protein LOC117223037 n=1 Tax=Megalopta genalis TaxID=115081 RepID=UPI003FD62A59